MANDPHGVEACYLPLMADRSGNTRNRAGRKAFSHPELSNQDASGQRPTVRRSVTNRQLHSELNQGNADRGTLLTHIQDRLLVMRELQNRESTLLQRGASYEWWRQVARANDAKTSIPDPNRWREPAKAYQRAIEALCRGDLARGQALLERAMESDDRVVRSTTELVSMENLDNDATPENADLGDMMSFDGLDPCEAPEIMSLAKEIQSVDIEVQSTPDIRLPWWAEEEEEEEEQQDENDDAEA